MGAAPSHGGHDISDVLSRIIWRLSLNPKPQTLTGLWWGIIKDKRSQPRRFAGPVGPAFSTDPGKETSSIRSQRWPQKGDC